MLDQPIQIYNNWSAYDELADSVELTEELAMRELDEMLRLREHGVRFDYYLMDAFWYAPDGGYRTWRKPSWPDGPDRWIERCLENDIKPGLWFATNRLTKFRVSPIPEWEDSVSEDGLAACMFAGGFLPDFMSMLQEWYDRGVRLFKFDFATFGARCPAVVRTHQPDEITRMNIAALRTALKLFRERNAEAVLLAYNGFGGDIATTSNPFFKNVDEGWLSVFDALYCGDPRPADVPCMDFWRSVDIYSDHQVRAYEFNGIPLERIDSCAFMMGPTGTCYRRAFAAWKGTLILLYARGGWVNHIYGNLEPINSGGAEWFAKVQSIFLPIQALGRTYTFGGIPGEGAPYGFASIDQTGALYTIVNPSQSVAEIEMPKLRCYQVELGRGRMLFSDAGFVPEVSGNCITLGPEQMALVGFGRYASSEFDLGVQDDVKIPKSIERVDAAFEVTASNTIAATIDVPSPAVTGAQNAALRIIMRQFLPAGRAQRAHGGAPPDGTPMDRILRISVAQQGRDLPVQVNYDKAMWCGISWGVGEVRCSDIAAGQPATISCRSDIQDAVLLEGQVFRVVYG